jgi:pyruvate/2-oxoglutarate dehydrogenase complex dihydrolipoamide acyltransferase (E2) component
VEFKDLVIPTLDVNDDHVTIGGIRKENLEYINEDEVLFVTETSKATEDYYPKYAGYVVLFVEELDEVAIGKSAGMIFKNLEDAKAKLTEVEAEKEKAKKLSSVKASKKALAYAEELGFDITKIVKDGIIKTGDIDEYIEKYGI